MARFDVPPPKDKSVEAMQTFRGKSKYLHSSLSHYYWNVRANFQKLINIAIKCIKFNTF
jgi:hypothetical protein